MVRAATLALVSAEQPYWRRCQLRRGRYIHGFRRFFAAVRRKRETLDRIGDLKWQSNQGVRFGILAGSAGRDAARVILSLADDPVQCVPLQQQHASSEPASLVEVAADAAAAYSDAGSNPRPNTCCTVGPAANFRKRTHPLQGNRNLQNIEKPAIRRRGESHMWCRTARQMQRPIHAGCAIPHFAEHATAPAEWAARSFPISHRS